MVDFGWLRLGDRFKSHRVRRCQAELLWNLPVNRGFVRVCRTAKACNIRYETASARYGFHLRIPLENPRDDLPGLAVENGAWAGGARECDL